MLRKFIVCSVAVAVLGGAACSSGGSGTPVASNSDDTFCDLLLAFRSSNDSLGSDVTSGDPVKSSAAMQRLVGQVQLLQQRAPANIKADIDTAAAFYVGLDHLLARYGYDLAKIEADPAAAAEFEAMNSDEVTVARDQLSTYGERKCGAAPPTDTVNPTPSSG